MKRAELFLYPGPPQCNILEGEILHIIFDNSQNSQTFVGSYKIVTKYILEFYPLYQTYLSHSLIASREDMGILFIISIFLE